MAIFFPFQRKRSKTPLCPMDAITITGEDINRRSARSRTARQVTQQDWRDSGNLELVHDFLWSWTNAQNPTPPAPVPVPVTP